jgi:hypothetical protein
MEGWVDQFVVIADASNQVSDNTNLSFTKRLMTEGFKVILGRPFKIILFDVGFIGVILFSMLKGMVPDSINNCVRVIGDDRVELIEELRLYMTDDFIP